MLCLSCLFSAVLVDWRMATDAPASDLISQITTAAGSLFSFMKVTILASSGIAALLSGLLYFKQKYGPPP